MSLIIHCGNICKLDYVCSLNLLLFLKRIFLRLFNWELWPFNVIYTPVFIVWIYYIIKARTVWYFSNVNPTLTFSGFEGEAKREMYQQLPRALYPTTVHVAAHEEPVFILERIKEAGLSFPFIAKPDIGTQGLLFRRIYTVTELLDYHRFLEGDYVVQPFIDLPEEYSVFYIRYPGEKKGKITGLILKEYMAVTGDGHSTLQQLIAQHPKAKQREAEMFAKHKEHLANILPKGEKFQLSIMGNHNRGARFINLHNEIDESLCAVFDAIADAVPQFHYGRYDLKCTSLKDLKEGRNIQILEYNGTGAEPNHIYDCGMSYGTALKVIAQHWKAMYEIGRLNKRSGIPYWRFLPGRKHLQRTYRWYAELRRKDLLFPL